MDYKEFEPDCFSKVTIKNKFNVLCDWLNKRHIEYKTHCVKVRNALQCSCIKVSIKGYDWTLDDYNFSSEFKISELQTELETYGIDCSIKEHKVSKKQLVLI